MYATIKINPIGDVTISKDSDIDIRRGNTIVMGDNDRFFYVFSNGSYVNIAKNGKMAGGGKLDGAFAILKCGPGDTFNVSTVKGSRAEIVVATAEINSNDVSRAMTRRYLNLGSSHFVTVGEYNMAKISLVAAECGLHRTMA